MYFIEPDGEVFFRGHQPDQHGDRLTRTTYKKAAETNRAGKRDRDGEEFLFPQGGASRGV